MTRFRAWWRRSWRLVVALTVIAEMLIAAGTTFGVVGNDDALPDGWTWWTLFVFVHLVFAGVAAFFGTILGLLAWAVYKSPYD